MLVPTRNYSNPVYRYGFQGQEKDDEIKGIGNSINYKFRMHNPRVGRFFAVVPEVKKYSFQSPYAFANNNPVRLVDVDGLGVFTDYIILKKDKKDKSGKVTYKKSEIVCADPNDGSEKDSYDRILKIYNDNEIRKKSNGKPRVAIHKIAKGILKEGMNFEQKDQRIKYGGQGQPTKEQVTEFIVNLSNYVHKEIAGLDVSFGDKNFFYLGHYKENTWDKSKLEIRRIFSRYSVNSYFHTHPDFGDGETKPSQEDYDSQKFLLKKYPKLFKQNTPFLIFWRNGTLGIETVKY